MIASNPRTILGLASATLAFSAPVLADCPVNIEHPEKVLFSVDMQLTSEVDRYNPDAYASNNAFVKQVPIWNDGSFGYNADCGTLSLDYENEGDQDWAWAQAFINASMSGQVLDNGFSLVAGIEGYVDSHSGSTSIDTEFIVAYKFTLHDDARFTFSNSQDIWNNDLDILVVIEDLETGIITDMTWYFNDLEEDAEPIAASTYELRVYTSFEQAGCDEFEIFGASEIEMRFYCPYYTRPGDINKDDIVNGLDLAILLGAFNTYEESADLNQDGKVDGTDLTYLLSDWG